VAGQAFDLNIERILEHWPVANAVRELIANALDEHHLSGTAEPVIEKVGDGRWVVRDHGRGLRYEHLTQNEDEEKLDHPQVIGQFGIGLKDALAVCQRRGIDVCIRSRHGDIRPAMRPKAGFPDLVTLHAVVSPPSDPAMAGTAVELTGVADEEVATALGLFVRYSGDEVLESTKFGDVLAKRDPSAPGRIYVKGMLVAEEENFLFSYDITKPGAPLRRALNRERTNVGRTAYADRVKAILTECRSAAAAGPLAADLGGFVAGKLHDELQWKDVAVHACRVLHSSKPVVFVTPWQVASASVSYAEADGYRPVVVPEDIARKLAKTTDLDGNPILDLRGYQRLWNESFSFAFVEPDELENGELAVLGLLPRLVELAGDDWTEADVAEVRISETMRLDDAGAPVLGVWDPSTRRIVIRRDQLADPAGFCGTVLHELEHALSGWTDGTLAFEEALTRRLGLVAVAGLS
jgi:hypothetical protein